MGMTTTPEARGAIWRPSAGAATLLGGLGSAEAAPPRGAMIQVSRGLGVFSFGLGLFGAMRPASLARAIGVPPIPLDTGFLRFVGIREIMAAGNLLLQPQESTFVWSRVAGDTMDVLYLTAKLALGKGTRKDRLVPALAAVTGIGVLDLYTAVSLSRRRGLGSSDTMPSTWRRDVEGAPGGTENLKDSMTIWKSPAEVYAFWRDFSNLSRFMRHVESVETMGDRRSHWTVKAPAGRTVEWDAEIVEDRPNELIAWRSVPGADVQNSGRVRFVPSPDGKGTEVHVEIAFAPPAGKLGATVVKLFEEDPHKQVHGDLRRLKQVLETGEVVRSEGALDSTAFPQHPASAVETGGMRA